jgi:alkyl sulfatase BDS1-like metallo-beta-lactamase superfamily hydrolase
MIREHRRAAHTQQRLRLSPLGQNFEPAPEPGCALDRSAETTNSQQMSVDLSDKGLRVAELVKSGAGQVAAVERAAGVYESRGVGNSYLLTTPEGDVLVNAGTLGDARRGCELFRQVSQQPIRYIVLTQSHANQYGGLEVYKTDDNRVIAQRTYVEDRRYSEALSPHYRRGSRRMFGQITGPTQAIVPTREVSPDVLFDERHDFNLGGRRFELHSTPGGETRSALIVWLPDEQIAVVGNLFGPLFGNQPNLNTIRGDKPRSALLFIESLKHLRALRPALVLTGHEAISGAGHIEREISRVIDAVQWLHDRTIEGMNAGVSLRRLMHEIKLPAELTLTEEYGKTAWNVRAIWHEYTGWFDPDRGTTELFGVDPAQVAPEIVALAGGSAAIIERAQRSIGDAQPLIALQLLEIALVAEPQSLVARDTKRAALELLLAQSGGKNLWERMWIAAELRELGADRS